MTKDAVKLQSLKVEIEVSRLMKLKKKYRKQKKLLKKHKRLARDTSSDKQQGKRFRQVVM